MLRTRTLLNARRGLVRYVATSAPSVKDEASEFSKRCSDMAEFFAQPRFANTKRSYTPEDVVSKQGSLPVLPTTGSVMADKLFGLLERAGEAKEPIHTMGAIDPVQMTQMAKNQQVVYVSGWACSSVLTTGNNEVGPDLG
jgi:isocitrate lyase